MKKISGYLHITVGFKEEYIKRHLDKGFILDYYIDDFINWGGNVYITNTTTYTSRQVSQHESDLMVDCLCETDLLQSLKFDDNPNFLVWEVSNYIKVLTRKHEHLEKFKEVLREFVSYGGVVLLDGNFYIDAKELFDTMNNIKEVSINNQLNDQK